MIGTEYSALELPDTEARAWLATPAYIKGQAQRWRAGQTVVLTLRPFEVRVWDLAPGP